MVFDTIQVKAVESSLSFKNTNGHRSTWRRQEREREREREIGESEMNNLKRHQQSHHTKVTFYSSSSL